MNYLTLMPLIKTWKDAQHHSLLEKCKSKPQWSIISCWSEWPSSKSLQTVSAREDMEKKELTLLHCWWECKLVQPLWRKVWRLLKKLGIELPYGPAITLLGIHTKETRIERDTCTPMLIAALFTIASIWKQLPISRWMVMRLWYICTVEYYSAIKGTHLSQF